MPTLSPANPVFRSLPALMLAALAALPLQAQEVITSHGISPFGDLKYPADFTHFDYVNPEAPKGGTMSFRGTNAIGTFDSLNAFILTGNAAQGLERLYDSLLVASADEPGAYYGLIAESLTWPEDRSWVSFRLRPEARFADGTPLTAEDVVWTFETLKRDGHPYYRISLETVETVEALGPHEVRFTFAEGANTRDLPSEVGGIAILPRHWYQSRDFTRASMDFPLGSGPYVVDRANPGRQIRYCRNPDYWAADLPVNAGTNNFDCVVYEYFSDTTAAFEALKAGAYLFHEEFSSLIWGTAYDFPSLKNGWVVREEIPDARPSGTQGFWFNLRREKFADPRVREAIAIQFNFEWSNETLFYGLYHRTDSFWENATGMQAEGLPEGEELAVLETYRDQLPDSIFTEPAYVPPVWDQRRNTDRRARARSAELMEQAGYTLDSAGFYRDPSGQRLTIEILDSNPAFQRIVEPFIQNLRQAGFDTTYTMVDYAQMEERQDDFDFDITSARLPMSMAPSIELRPTFGSQGAATQGTLNLAGIADPVIDALIEEIISADSREAMEARVRAMDRVLRAKHVWVPNWYSGRYLVAYWDIFGRPEIQPPYSRGLDHWWLDQGKLDALRAKGALR